MARGRSSAVLRRGAARGFAGAPQRGAGQGRSTVGAATWGCAGAQQRGAALEGSVGLRRGAAARGCAGEQQRVGLGRGVAARGWVGA